MTNNIEEPTGIGIIKLQGCQIASVRADLLSRRVTLRLTLDLDDQLLDAQRQLSWFSAENTHVDIQITEQQMRLPLTT